MGRLSQVVPSSVESQDVESGTLPLLLSDLLSKNLVNGGWKGTVKRSPRMATIRRGLDFAKVGSRHAVPLAVQPPTLDSQG